MKNKGFTLIELITVIVLLGIIASIIVPKINDSIIESKNELASVQMKNIKEAARSWAADNIFVTPKPGETIYITLGDLKNGGYIDEDVINPLTKEKYPDDMIIKIIAGENGKISIEIDENQDNKFDPQAPKIALSGSAVVYIEVDANNSNKYVDEGVVAYAQNGEKISKEEISIIYEKKESDGTYKNVTQIDTSVIAKYRITYSVTDNNLTSKAYRNVIVRDTTPPKITVDGHTSDYVINIPLGNDTIKIPEQSDVEITDNSCINCTIEPTIVGNDKVNINTAGIYYITYSAKDGSNNSSKLVLKVYVSVIPTFTFDNPSINKAKNGSIVTYKMHLSEQEYSDLKINSQDFTINKTGTANAEIIGVNQNKYEYEIIIRTLSGDGTISVTPKAGIVRTIEGTLNEAKPTSPTFVVDNTAPNVSFEPTTDNWYRENIDVQLNIDDASGIGISFYCVTSSEICTPTILYSDKITLENEGQYKICTRLIDKLGNEKTTCSENYKIDKTAPTCEVTNIPLDWVNGSVNLIVQGNDNLSDVAGIKYSSDSTYSSNPLSYPTASNGTYKFNVIDQAGNTNECGGTIDKIDNTKPIITNAYDEEGWSSNNKKITIVAEDTLSGIAGYQITNNTDIPSVFIESNDSTFESTETYSSGTYYTWVKDKAGNISDYFEVIVDEIDTTNPIVELTPSPSNEWTNEDIYIDLNASDPESDVDEIKYCIKNTDTSCEPNISLEKGENIPITNDGDNYYVCVKVTNNAGLETSLCSNYDSKYYKLDKTYPTCELSLESESCKKDGVTAILTGNDILSELHELPYAFDDGEFGTIDNKLYSVNGTITGKVRDKALNTNTCTRTIENIDNEAPDMSVSLSPTTPDGLDSWYKTTPTLQVTGSDTGCGSYSGYQYQISINDGDYSALSSTQVDDSALNNEITNNECNTIKAKITGYDGVSNTSTVETSNFKYDKTAPVITVDGHTSDYSVEYEPVTTYENGTEVYYNPETGQICDDYVADNSLNENKSGCMKWYIFNDEEGKDTVDMILDHNTTYQVAWISGTDYTAANTDGTSCSYTSCNDEGPITANNQLASDVSGWVSETRNSARMITADEVWQITRSTNGVSGWNSATATTSEDFYFDGNKLSGQGTSKYPWLFDYTRSCTSYGCNVSDSGTYGYWTSSPIIDDSHYAWRVYYNGHVSDSRVYSTSYGLRPVITIDKSLFTYQLPTGTSTDNCGGTPTVTTSGSVNTSVPGNYPIKYSSTDNAGNSTTLNLTVKVLDKTNPRITFDPISDNACHSSSYNVTLTATDNVEVASLLYCQTTGNNSSCTPTTTANPAGTSISINTDSEYHVICAQATDSSGNITTECSNSEGNYYSLDTTGPDITNNINPSTANGSNGWYKTLPTVNITGSDLGCGTYTGYKYQTSIDGGKSYSDLSALQTNDTALNNEIASNECKTIQYKITGYDGNNNSSSIYTSNSFKYDKTAPVITVDGHTSDYSVEYEPISVYEDGTAVYYNPETGQICDDYVEANSLNENKSGCMKWYIFNDEESKDTVDMILDHNIVYLDLWNSSGFTDSGPGSDSGDLLGDLKSYTSSWVGVPARTDSYTDPLNGYTIDYSGYKARLIEANEIWQITQSTNGKSGWNSAVDSYFFFEGSSLSGQGTSKYAWLYDYTYNCTSYGCNIADSGTYGYWTSSASSYNYFYVWTVDESGGISPVKSPKEGDTINYGLRPVITIDKSLLKTEYIIPTATATDNCSGDVTVSMSGDTQIEFSVPGSYPIVYTSTDSAGNTKTLTLTLNVKDITPPVITVDGNTSDYSIEITEGIESFTLPTGTATDDSGETIDVITSGSVNTSLAGNYEVKYTATDSAGNSTTLILTVVVKPSGYNVTGVCNGVECSTVDSLTGVAAGTAVSLNSTSMEVNGDTREVYFNTCTFKNTETNETISSSTLPWTISCGHMYATTTDSYYLKCSIDFTMPDYPVTVTCDYYYESSGTGM